MTEPEAIIVGAIITGIFTLAGVLIGIILTRDIKVRNLILLLAIIICVLVSIVGYHYFFGKNISIAIAPGTPVNSEVVIYINAMGAYIWDAPQTKGIQFRDIVMNTDLVITGRTSDNLFLRVNHEGVDGWISNNRLIEIEGDINSVPIIDD